jgi:hypothetical protein
MTVTNIKIQNIFQNNIANCEQKWFEILVKMPVKGKRENNVLT